MSEPHRPRSHPHILDLPDGCPGYCIARRSPRGDWPEYWHRTKLGKHLWSSVPTIYPTLEEAYQALTKAQRTGNTP